VCNVHRDRKRNAARVAAYFMMMLSASRSPIPSPVKIVLLAEIHDLDHVWMSYLEAKLASSKNMREARSSTRPAASS